MSLYYMKSKVAAIIATILISSIFTVTSSLIFNNNANALQQLQFPKSQQLDLKAINSAKPPITSNFNLMKGYVIQPVLWNLTLPSAVTFDNNNGTIYVAEAGYAYGGLQPQPRILKVQQNGNTSILVDRLLNGPITDIEFHDGKLYVSHRGAISTVDPNRGSIKDIIVGLPSIGDHFNNQIAFGADGRMYFGQGTATNSGIVGEDNYAFGWLKLAPTFHDIPGKSITLTGQNFVSANPLVSPVPKSNATTGAFVPFGNTTAKGQVIKGNIKCSGCILSAKPDGTDLKLVAWGLRNPYGLAFDKDGKNLVISMNGADERGSRPIANDKDKIYTIDVSNSSSLGKFYGWPDYFGNAQPVTDPIFKSPRGKQPLQFLMQNHPTPIQKPFALIQTNAGTTQVTTSNSSTAFGLDGKAFVGQFGSLIPITHAPTPQLTGKIIGQRVAMVDLKPAGKNNNVADFLSLKSNDTGFRPIGIKFNNKENALYIVSMGKFEVRTTLPNGIPLPMPTPWGYAHTGIIWKIMKSGGGSVTTTTTPPSTGPTGSANNTANRTASTGSTTTSPIGIPGVP